MSFNFGGGGSGTGGFSFASPATSSTGTTGFSFASPTSTASGGTGGFTFTPPASVQTTTSATGFSFNRPPTTAAAGTGFSFANPPTTTQSSSFGSSLFAPAQQTQQTAPATAAPSGGGFSFASGTPATSTAGSGFSFNAASAASNSGTGNTGNTPGTGFSFSATTTTAGATPVTTAASLFNFGIPKPLTGTTPAATTTQGTSASATSTSGTMPSLFSTPASQPQPSLATTSLLGQAMAKVPSTSNVSASTTPSLPSASTPLLGAAPATSTVSLTSVTVTTAPLTTLSTATSTTSASGPAAVGSSVVAATPTLNVRGLEEKVNKWVSELREQEERLMRQAAHVNAWDQLLQQGHDQVQELRDTLNKVKVDQQRLQAELDFIQGQQQELEQLIEPLEAAVASTTPAQHQGDRQRENMHHLAQNLHAQIHQITEDLCKVIEHLNSNNSSSQASDPVNTVARVLSAHMDTLKWVDQNCALISQKIDDLSRAVDSKRRD